MASARLCLYTVFAKNWKLDNATEFFTQFEYNSRFYSLTLDGPQHTSEINQVHVSTIEYLY